ncbi:MAG: class I SAM-dependent methyltransferase [Thermoguttaceae bacterium]
MKTLRHALISSLVAALVMGLSVAAVAQEESVRPGINKSYENADIEQSVKRFEGDGREIFQHREEIVEACDLKPGMNVADVGAGTGLFTRLFAPKVLAAGSAAGSAGGTVYAVDITEKFIAHIKATCAEQKIENVETVLCTSKSTKLEPRSVDLVFTCDTYHHFEFPYKTLASIRRALRRGGRLIVVDFKKEDAERPDWVNKHVRANKKTVIEEVTKAGFKLIDEPELMKGQYMLRFEKVKR